MTNEHALTELLIWYKEMGVDAAIAPEAMDWLDAGRKIVPGAAFAWPERAVPAGTGGEVGRAASPSTIVAPAASVAPATAAPAARDHAAAPQPGSPSRPTPPRPTSVTGDDAIMTARRLARAAPTLAALQASLSAFDGCPLKTTATKLCFYRGAERARLMVIGEAPGRDEDLEGSPFVGPAGQLLDKMLASIGLLATDVHITNVVYWRPPGNRTPTPQETEVCRPFLERQMELVEPEAVLLLGGAAAKQVLGLADGILRIRGKWRELQIANRTVQAMPTLHPAYLLRTPVSKRLAWRDLLAVAEALEQSSPAH